MPKGGKREGAGRKPGSKSNRTKKLEETIAFLTGKKKAKPPTDGGAPASPASPDAAGPPVVVCDDETMPLAFLLEVMRGDHLMDVRIDAAKAAAPYCHQKLSSVEHKGDLTVTHEEALKALA